MILLQRDTVRPYTGQQSCTFGNLDSGSYVLPFHNLYVDNYGGVSLNLKNIQCILLQLDEVKMMWCHFSGNLFLFNPYLTLKYAGVEE